MEEKWEIVYIPDKPPMSPHRQPTVDVFAASIDPKLANTLVRNLNKIMPLESLRHVKRVHKKLLEGGGRTQLWVILCVAPEENHESCNSSSSSIPLDVQELITSYQLTPFKTKVCKYAASSKLEWEEQCKLWPTSYHPPTYNIDGITGFSNEDTQSILSFMNFAIQLGKSGGGSVFNAAVIVDPSVKKVVSSARDQTCSGNEYSCLKEPEASSLNTDSEGMPSCKTLPSGGLSDETKQFKTSVSCLDPWRWAEQQPHMSSSCWHPLHHAAIVAIESSAARDRQLFPNFGDHKPTDLNKMQSSSTGSAAKRQKTNTEKITGDNNLNSCGEDSDSQLARPYLCTGYDIYLVWEPCTMCAMALVHQRIRRIFFAFPNSKAGALGSVYRLQGERSLNHHYAVFRVLVPEEILHGPQTC